MSGFLTDKDIERLTGRGRRKDRLAALRDMGIRHTQNKRGEILVLWSAVEAVLGPRAQPAGGLTSEPDTAAFS